MTDEMLRALARNGGVCMINFFSAFISQDVAEVVLRSAKRDKMERPADVGGTEELPNDRTDWDAFLHWFRSLGCPAATLDQVADHVFHAADVAGIDHVGIGSDFDGVPSLPEGLTSASMLPSLTARLLERGMSESDVEKVLGGNFMRVLDEVERRRLGG
jgi:membrane dipeptidase